MKAGKVDGRTGPAKARDNIVAVLSGDWGGLEAMPGAARLLADQLAVLGVRCILRGQRLIQEASQGVDDPTSDKHTIALFNGFRRGLQTLEEMRAREGAGRDRTPTLDEYLSAHGNSHANSATGPQANANGADHASPFVESSAAQNASESATDA